MRWSDLLTWSLRCCWPRIQGQQTPLFHVWPSVIFGWMMRYGNDYRQQSCWCDHSVSHSLSLWSSPTQHPHGLHRDMGGPRRSRPQSSQPSQPFKSEAVTAAESFIILSVFVIVSPTLCLYVNTKLAETPCFTPETELHTKSLQTERIKKLWPLTNTKPFFMLQAKQTVNWAKYYEPLSALFY